MSKEDPKERPKPGDKGPLTIELTAHQREVLLEAVARISIVVKGKGADKVASQLSAGALFEHIKFVAAAMALSEFVASEIVPEE
jgi:hypothetical protein